MFASVAAGTTVSFHVYFPPGYEDDGDCRYPVLFWLHGMGQGVVGIPQLAELYDSAIRKGKIPAMLVVFPHGMAYSMWCDSAGGHVPMESVVIDELVPLVDVKFRTTGTRAGRMVEGFSMGGYGAARLGFSYPDLFGAVSILGGGPLQLELLEAPRVSPRVARQVLEDVYGGDPARFRAMSPWRNAEQNADQIRDEVHIRQVVGARDETLRANLAFHAHMMEVGIPHDFIIVEGVGHHPLALLRALGAEHWRFYRTAFGA